MKWHELGEMSCPIARSLSIFGDRWTLLIIRNAFLRTRRFDDFQKSPESDNSSQCAKIHFPAW